jgi:hypothetical protein
LFCVIQTIKKEKMKNWKTTACGFLVAVGTTLQAVEDPKIKISGIALVAIASLAFGYHAADKK